MTSTNGALRKRSSAASLDESGGARSCPSALAEAARRPARGSWSTCRPLLFSFFFLLSVLRLPAVTHRASSHKLFNHYYSLLVMLAFTLRD